MNIGFDAKRLFNNFTGLGNYSRFVVSALCQYAPDNTYYLYTPKTRQHPDVTPLVSEPSVRVVTPPVLYTFFHAFSIWRSWGIGKNPTVKNLQLFHGLSQELPGTLPSRLKKVVTVHDLIFMRFPKLYNPIDVAIYTAKVKAACKAADVVIAISQQTMQDLVDFLGVPQSKIVVVYQGCHPQFRQHLAAPLIDDVRRRHGLPERYLLNVGTIEVRKNIATVVKALGMMPPATRIPLVIVGKATPYKAEVEEAAKKANISADVIFLHHVPFADLPALYRGAAAFVYPSTFEGFGIPIVEALESGVPVVTSVGSCFSEAAGQGALYVNPSNAEEMAFHLNRLLMDQSLRHQLVADGREHIKQFTPEVIAGNLMKVYRQL